MVEQSKKKVVITGISGFLGSHITKAYLDDGTYSVRGTVRDKYNEEKLGPLRQAFGEKFDELELCEADLLKPETIAKAIEGCDYVVHTASPFPIAMPRDENELIRPAVEGTLAVLRAAAQFKIKRVVITSSVAAIMFKSPENLKPEFDESDWSDMEVCSAYDKSKTLAEQAAWDYQRSLPENERFELVILNPALIVGPTLVTGNFTSGVIVYKILTGAFPGMPKVQFPFVDVRDVAFAHLQALKLEEAKNQRFIINKESAWFREIAEYLHMEFGQEYYFQTGELRYCTLRLASWFDSSAAAVLPLWGREYGCNNQRSIDVLGIEYHSLDQSIVDMAHSMINSGLIVDKRQVKK